MDASFVIAVGIVVCLLSVMVIARMAAMGARPARIAVQVGELWVVFAVWGAVFGLLTGAVGRPEGRGAVGELRELGSRLYGLGGLAKVLAIAGLAAAAALAGHLVWSLRRSMT